MNELSPTTRQGVEMVTALILKVAKVVVNDSECLRAEIAEENGRLVLVLIVPERDMKWLIGRNGRTAQALRALTDALTAPLKQRLALQIRSDTAKASVAERRPNSSD